MTENASRILSYVSSLSTDGKPVVVELDELTKECSGDIQPRDVKELALNGYIKLLYSEGETFCVQPTGKKLPANTAEATSETFRTSEKHKSPGISFKWGFLGGIIGGVLVVLVAIAVYFVTKTM